MNHLPMVLEDSDRRVREWKQKLKPLPPARQPVQLEPVVAVVETQVVASRRDAAGDAFRSLFNYISGNNDASLKIPMTSPVAQIYAGRERDNVSGKWAVRFFLPKDLSAEAIPEPLQLGVNIVTLSAQRFASVSFKGTQNDKKVAKNRARLREFIAQNGYRVSGQPVYAFYDPPFVPWFLRDNEILLPIEKVSIK